MSKAAALLRIRWVPWALAGGLAVVGGAFAGGYLRGKDVTEARMEAEKRRALTEQLAELQRVHAEDMADQLARVKRERDIREEVGNVEFPEVGAACSDQLVEWVRAYNRAVGLSGTSTE